jgi:hypothetical protein
MSAGTWYFKPGSFHSVGSLDIFESSVENEGLIKREKDEIMWKHLEI